MSTKKNPSVIPRFTGKDGHKNLLFSICSQQSVAGNAKLAEKLIAAGSLHACHSGKSIISQEGVDNDFYMIISGSVKILINKREVATRSAGAHFGEMALLDPTAKRSATIIAKEQTVFLKISEPDITRISKSFPDFWRRLAVELSTRLRERSKFIREPNSKPIVFIGSSSEALKKANYIEQALSKQDLTCHLWTKGVFQLSQTSIEDLIRFASISDFAVFLLTPDDTTTSRGRRKVTPRDNVIFELGLFMGAIGRERTFIVAQQGCNLKLPTDILGVTLAMYSNKPSITLSKQLSPISQILLQRIALLGSR